jgi:hypothetical protein
MSHATTVVVPEGGVAQIHYGGEGRPVTGRLVSEPGSPRQNWDAPWLVRRSRDGSWAGEGGPMHGSVFVQSGNFITRKARVAAIHGLMADTARLERSLPPTHYRLEVDADGNFRGEDIPPGTYDLCVRATESAGMNSFVVVAETVHELAVPEGTAPWEAGTVVVPERQGVLDY